jgi:hydrogenase expression/formation protein HypC
MNSNSQPRVDEPTRDRVSWTNLCDVPAVATTQNHNLNPLSGKPRVPPSHALFNGNPGLHGLDYCNGLFKLRYFQTTDIQEPSMCLGIPGRVMTIYREHELLMGKISFGGVTKQACLEHLPESEVGDYVLVHVGFALAKIDEAEAKRVFAFLDSMQELDELRVPDSASGTQSGDT